MAPPEVSSASASAGNSSEAPQKAQQQIDVVLPSQAAPSPRPEEPTPRSDASEPDTLSELATASFAGDERKVDALLAHGVDVNRRERKGATALMLALASYVAEPECCEQSRKRRLQQVTEREQRKLSIARKLIEHGADVTVSDKMDLTPLHYAVMSNGREASVIEVMELLIARGADVNRRSQPYGRTALEWAVERSPERVEFLLRNGADARLVTHEGKTLLEVAEARGDERTVRELKAALAK